MIGVKANAQNLEIFSHIDSIKNVIDIKASEGLLDTLKGSLFGEGNTASDFFGLKEVNVIRKISIINKSKKYEEYIYILNDNPIFIQVNNSNVLQTIYIVDKYSFLKKAGKVIKSKNTYWAVVTDSYLGFLKNQLN